MRTSSCNSYHSSTFRSGLALLCKDIRLNAASAAEVYISTAVYHFVLPYLETREAYFYTVQCAVYGGEVCHGPSDDGPLHDPDLEIVDVSS